MTSTIFFFAFIPLLALILLAVNLIFAPHSPYMEKEAAFECGFSSFLGQNRTQFSISFFIFALLFLLFDLEILLVYPYLVSAYTNDVYGLAIMLMFLLALTLGFAFELGKKALSIDSRQGSSESHSQKGSSTSLSSVLTSPRPSSSIRAPLQSGYLSALFVYTYISMCTLLSRIRGLATFEALTVLIIAIGFSLAYRYPMLIILESLGLRGYYPWANLVITLCFLVTITELRCKKAESVRLAIACVFALLIPAAIWYFGSYDSLLLISTSVLSQVSLSLTDKLSALARGIRILWGMVNGEPDKLSLGPHSPAKPPKVSAPEVKGNLMFLKGRAQEPGSGSGQGQGQGGSGSGQGQGQGGSQNPSTSSNSIPNFSQQHRRWRDYALLQSISSQRKQDIQELIERQEPAQDQIRKQMKEKANKTLRRI